MNREEGTVYKIVKRLIDDGTLDELVMGVLEGSLEAAFEELEALSKKTFLQAHHWQDYADNLQFARASLVVLRYYSVDGYEAEQRRVSGYSLKLEEFY
jgi:hypothetical protein